MFWIVVAFEGGLAALGAALAWLTGVTLPSPLPDQWLVGIGASLPLCAFYVFFERSPLPGFERIRRFLNEVVRPLFTPMPPGGAWLVALAAGVGEEVLFRGFLQTGLVSLGLGPLAAIVLTSIAFGAAHCITPLYAVVTTGMGLYLGTFFWATGDLGVAILIHAIYDGFALSRLLRKL